MDFHSLPRRELQALCKKNRIPANITNVAMADALRALHTGGAIEGMEETLWNQSPKNVQAISTDLPGSSRRTSARRAVAPALVEPREQQASPLPRARRVTAKAAEIEKLFSEEEEEEEDKEEKDGPVETTPIALVKRSTTKKSQGATTTRRTSKKDDVEAAEGLVKPTKTPATRTGRRPTARRGAESSVGVEEGTEDTVVSSRITTRRTRQSSKSIAVDDPTTTVRRCTRTRAGASIRQMETLAQEEAATAAEQVEEVVQAKNYTEGHDGSRNNTSDLATSKMPDLEEPEGTVGEKCGQDSNLDVVEADLPQSQLEKDGLIPESEGSDDVNELENETQPEEGIKTHDSLERDDTKPSDSTPGDASHLCFMKSPEMIEEETDGDQDKDVHGENCEQECNVVVEDTSLPLHQLAVDDAEVVNEEPVPDAERGCEGEQESPVEGLVSCSENLEIDGDAVREESKNEEETKNSSVLDLSALEKDEEESGNGEDEIPEEAVDNTAEVAASSPPQQIHLYSTSSERSNAVDSTAETLTQVEVGAASGLALKTAGVVFEADKSENKIEHGDRCQHRDADDENKILAESTMTAVICGEDDAEKQGSHVDLNCMSLRKLKMLYKEKISDLNSKVEGRRLALAEINKNII
ncbi:hypothetical protein OPV22_035089 [Ensete ventricosum]|uniref:Uncharacterized protein n=1 Tax=Ensete ventricosum TaxID=4639 RepID=A0AAX5K1S3_ENSVE|nr:hypothetical protein OPV22_035089 [Ensete ventricosum]